MVLLSNGYKLPQDDDDGSVWWDSVAYDIQRLNDHTHDGTDSEILEATTQDISSADWVSVATDSYRQLVTLPTGYTFDDILMEFRTSAGLVMHPTVEKVSASTYYVYVVDNTLDLVALYGS